MFVVNTDWFFLSHRAVLAEAVEASGGEVAVVAGDTGLGSRIASRGWHFVSLPISRAGTNPFEDLRTFTTLWRAFRRLRPTLVHNVTLKPVIYGTQAARLARIPAVVNAVSGLGYVFAREGRARWVRSLVASLLRLSLGHRRSAVVLQNQGDLNLFVARGWAPRERTRLIPGAGVDCDRFRPTPEPPAPPHVVALVGRMLRDKGVNVFVEAARRLSTDPSVEARFLLVGPLDPDNPSAVDRRTLEGWQREGVVEWQGYRSDMATVFRAAHLVVVPSVYGEGLPKVLLEAGAAGRAVVVSDVAGCREAVRQGESGLVVPRGDAELLADAVRRLLVSPKMRQRMGRAGRRRALNEFAVERVQADTLSLYLELLGRSLPTEHELVASGSSADRPRTLEPEAPEATELDDILRTGHLKRISSDPVDEVVPTRHAARVDAGSKLDTWGATGEETSDDGTGS